MVYPLVEMIEFTNKEEEEEQPEIPGGQEDKVIRIIMRPYTQACDRISQAVRTLKEVQGMIGEWDQPQ